MVLFREGKSPEAAAVEILNVESQQNRLLFYPAGMRGKWLLIMTFLPCGVALQIWKNWFRNKMPSEMINPEHQQIEVSRDHLPACVLAEGSQVPSAGR